MGSKYGKCKKCGEISLPVYESCSHCHEHFVPDPDWSFDMPMPVPNGVTIRQMPGECILELVEKKPSRKEWLLIWLVICGGWFLVCLLLGGREVFDPEGLLFIVGIGSVHTFIGWRVTFGTATFRIVDGKLGFRFSKRPSDKMQYVTQVKRVSCWAECEHFIPVFYNLEAELSGPKKIQLLEDVRDARTVLFLEREIEKALGIPPLPPIDWDKEFNC